MYIVKSKPDNFSWKYSSLEEAKKMIDKIIELGTKKKYVRIIKSK